MLFGRMRVVNHVKLFNLSSNESKCYIARQTTEVMEKFKRLYSVYPEAEREKQLFSFFFFIYVSYPRDSLSVFVY